MNDNLIKGEISFGINIMQNLDSEASFVFSPFSVMMSLCLVHAGAKETTKYEIREAVLPGTTDAMFVEHFSYVFRSATFSQKVNVALGNKIYARKGHAVRSDFLRQIRDNYNSSAERIDFSNVQKSAEIVNNFFNQSTQGKISKMVEQAAFNDTAAFLLNAFYYQGDWQDKFLASSTRILMFHRNYTPFNRIHFLIDMEAEYRQYSEDENCDVLKLPYEDDHYSFLYIRPNPDIGLEGLRKIMTAEKLLNLLANMTYRRVNIIVPKIKLNYEVDLKEVLPKVGIKSLFTDHADLSGIGNGFKISYARTKSFLDINEDETAATAATYYKVILKSLRTTQLPLPPIIRLSSLYSWNIALSSWSSLMVDEDGVDRSFSLKRGSYPHKNGNGTITFFAGSSFMFALVHTEHMQTGKKEHLLQFGQFNGPGGIEGYPEDYTRRSSIFE